MKVPLMAKAKGPVKRPLSKRAAKKSAQDQPDDVTAKFEEALQAVDKKAERYVLRLYVTGSTARSAAAISNIRKLCEEHLAGRCDLEVIDIYQQPTLAQGEQIIAAPTLIKKLPFPLRKLVGDLSNEQRVLMGLDIRSHDGAH
jgi:circadian clock protein KaiB